MNARARAERRLIRTRAAASRLARRATRAVATGAPQPAKVHLVAAGLDPQLARRFAGAFSQRVTPTAVGETVVKLRGRVRKTVAVKLYSLAAFVTRLATYRPKDRAAAAQFERIAYALAA